MFEFCIRDWTVVAVFLLDIIEMNLFFMIILIVAASIYSK
jgi:hypothetical protein